MRLLIEKEHGVDVWSSTCRRPVDHLQNLRNQRHTDRQTDRQTEGRNEGTGVRRPAEGGSGSISNSIRTRPQTRDERVCMPPATGKDLTPLLHESHSAMNPSARSRGTPPLMRADYFQSTRYHHESPDNLIIFERAVHQYDSR